ncbi:MAG: carboxypeptidase-like regulatory domain-containing protein, partial [Candidatus Acidiferrales bacterium]
MIRATGLALAFCLSLCVMAGAVSAAPSSGKITGLVVDSAGAPQMGATVIVTSDQLLNNLSFQLVTNDRGRFSTSALPAGLYS